MANDSRKIFLAAETVIKLLSVLKKQVKDDSLNITNKRLVHRLIAQLQAELDATPREGITLSKKLVDTILMTLANLLSDSRVVRSLIDLFFGDKK